MSSSAPVDGEESPALATWELWMHDPAEAIHRQVHPRFIHDGLITFSAFVARQDEDYKLSMTRSSVVSAQAATAYFTKVLGRRSVGSAKLFVGEVDQRGSRCVDNSGDPSQDLPPGHCYVDFRALTKRKRQELRIELAEIASARGIIPSD